MHGEGVGTNNPELTSLPQMIRVTSKRNHMSQAKANAYNKTDLI